MLRLRLKRVEEGQRRNKKENVKRQPINKKRKVFDNEKR